MCSLVHEALSLAPVKRSCLFIMRNPVQFSIAVYNECVSDEKGALLTVYFMLDAENGEENRRGIKIACVILPQR